MSRATMCERLRPAAVVRMYPYHAPGVPEDPLESGDVDVNIWVVVRRISSAL